MSMASKVLDAYAIMAFFEDEPGADFVREAILKAEKGDLKLFTSVVNLGEIWYSIARTTSPKTADQYVQELQGMAIEIVNADWPLTRQAAAFKVNGNLPYGDCFAAALAKIHKADLVTGDKEFKGLESEIRIDWV
jgi:predicted nucleic acid-binding protein